MIRPGPQVTLWTSGRGHLRCQWDAGRTAAIDVLLGSAGVEDVLGLDTPSPSGSGYSTSGVWLGYSTNGNQLALLIIPAPTLMPVASSIRMNEPVARFFEYGSHNSGTVVRS